MMLRQIEKAEAMMNRPTLLLATATILAAGTARAEDLPVAEPLGADLNQALCSIHGPGFYLVPGTETCLKIGGRVRIDAGYLGGDLGSDFRNASSAAEGRARFESRTDTDFGQVRIVIDKDFELDSAER
jgi:hypothetical protein